MTRSRSVMGWIRNASEVSAGILIVGCGCLLGVGVLIKFLGLRASPYFHLIPTEYGIPLLATVVGYTMGRASRDATPEELRSFKESLERVLRLARRDLIAGSSFYRQKMREISGEANEANLRKAVAAETLFTTYRDLGKAKDPTGEGRRIRERIRSLLQIRDLRAWLDEEPASDTDGRRYRLTLRYVLPGTEGENAAATQEPSRFEAAHIQVNVSSQDVRLTPGVVELKVPEIGPSESRSISAVPLHDGMCEISFAVSLLPRLELLQTYKARFLMEAGESPALSQDGGDG